MNERDLKNDSINVESLNEYCSPNGCEGCFSKAWGMCVLDDTLSHEDSLLCGYLL